MDLMEIMKLWKEEAGITKYRRETIGVHQFEDKLFVVTQRPGYFIGYHGELVDKYRWILRDNGYPSDVRFVDLGCGGVRIF